MKSLFYLLCLFSAQFTFAQSELPEGFGDYRSIKDIEPGKVYTQAYIPPTFKTVIWRDSVLLLENNRHLLTNLTEGKDYDIKTEIIETHPAYTILKFEEPKIDTIIEEKTIIVDRICEEIEPMPEYENQVIIGRQKMFNESTMFIPRPMNDDFMSRCTPYNLRKNKDAYFSTYAKVEVPARYVSFHKQVFQKDGKWWTETIADTLYLKRHRYLITKVKKSIKHVPAIIDTFDRIIIYEEVLNQLVQLSFSTIYVQKNDKEDYFTEWKEIYCAPYCGSARIKPIQEALIKKGYNTPTDNIFGKETKAALIQFQKDNNLPVGQLDKETLKLLGYE